MIRGLFGFSLPDLELAMFLRRYSSMEEYLRNARERCWRIYDQYYRAGVYRHHNERYQEVVMEHLRPSVYLLDAGCGAAMKITRVCAPKIRMAIGVDLEEMECNAPRLHGVRSDLQHLPFKNESFDVIISMSVLEHLAKPDEVFGEISRLLRPGGVAILQTPNKYDYVSFVARYTPFRFHKWLLPQIESREEEETFPTFFRANTERQIRLLLEHNSLHPLKIHLFNQYPAYLMFSPLLFRLGILYERLTSRYQLLAPLRSWILTIAEKRV